jgi:branched-chain amino acid transport system permease protein
VGPLLGVVPLILLSEVLQVRFPFWYSVLLGLVFMVIVYMLPRGISGLVEDGGGLLARPWPRLATASRQSERRRHGRAA